MPIPKCNISAPSASVLDAGRNVWRLARADRVSVVVDAAPYFKAVRDAMLQARSRIMLIGWDFDTRIGLDRDHKPGDPPTSLGEFILWLVRTRPNLEIKILKWDIGALKMLARGSTITTAIRWALHKRIQFKLDGAHPTGASHHQKIVVIDDSFAVCGGIDMTSDRWDTPEHRGVDRRRKRPGGKPYGPWHDITMLVDGEAAQALGQLARSRWEAAGGEALQQCATQSDLWPRGVEPTFRNVDLGIARTRGEYRDSREIREIESLFIDMIASADRFIYAENQYFASRKIAETIAGRMAERDPPEIILVNAANADGWLEQQAMDSARTQLIAAIDAVDHAGRFRVYHPVSDDGTPIYVHAKMMIVDDRILRIGSANMNNRSLGLDSECDLVLDADRQGLEAAAAITGLRHRLMAEHLGVAVDRVAAVFDKQESLIGAIEALRGQGRSLRPYKAPELSQAQQYIAENELFDPEKAGTAYEPLAARGLFRGRNLLRSPA